jgi:hypothetical protein
MVSLKAQVKWSINLVQSGIYQVVVLPEDTIKSVSFKASLISSSGSTPVNKEFTNSAYPELFPGYTYCKRYYCDDAVTKVIGEELTCFPHVELPTGAHALIMALTAPPSQKINESDKKIDMGDDQPYKKIVVNPIVYQQPNLFIIPTCQVQPNFKDLDDWLMANATNTLHVEVTIINQSYADGQYFFTAWGKSFFQKGSGSEGSCLLKTNPDISLLYSDRYYTVPGNPNNLVQRFSFYNQGDNQSLTLDLASGSIVCKSTRGSFEETFVNVIRRGNIIYGFKDGRMIILNLHKSK